MQLSIDRSFTNYCPPKGQLLKWIGNKQKFAVEITKHFPDTFGTYYEPFIGSGAIMATVNPIDGVCSDVFAPLVGIFKQLKTNPKGLIAWYDERRKLVDEIGKKEAYEQIKSSYNSNPNAPDFLFLSRSCYGGVIRFRKRDGFMSTPCGAHTPISTASFAKRVKTWHQRVQGVRFEAMDYQDAFDEAKAGDLIYCDPPYSFSQSIIYGAHDFSLVRLFEKIEEAKERGVMVALSIDGRKKSGNMVCDIPIPDNLFDSELMVEVGSSMLKRFQMDGKDMKGEDVADRLLLTYSQ